MAQTIKIKRSTGSSAPATLAQGELAYSKGSDTFYVGDPAAANTPIPVGGAIKNNAGTAVLATGITAGEIRTLIDVDQAGTDNSTDVTLSGTPDYITISGQTITRNAINLGTDVTSTLPVANGGTGATTASGARTALGVAIGSDVLAYDSNLQSFVTTFTLPTTDGSSGQVLVTNGSGTLSFSTVSVTDEDVSVANLQTRLGQITTATTMGSGASADFTFVSDVIISGDLTVNGTTTTINTEELKVDDNIITLNYNVTGTPTENAGIEIERGTSANVLVRWNEATDRWGFTNDGSTYYNIPISSEYTNNTGTVTSVGGTGTINGISLSGTVTSSGNLTLGGTLSGVTISQLEATDIITSGESFVDTDDQLMTAAAIEDRILSKGYTTNVGDITGVTAGVGLSGGGTSGTVSLALDFSELTDMTAGISGTTEFILQNGTTESRKAASEIALSNFSNDSGWTSNTGTVTSVGGTGTVSGLSLSGSVTSSGNLTLGGTLSGVLVSSFNASAITTSAEGFADNDTTLMTSAAIDDRILSYGYTTNTGDITSVQISSTDGSLSGTGTGSTGAISFDLEVATIDGGTY